MKALKKCRIKDCGEPVDRLYFDLCRKCAQEIIAMHEAGEWLDIPVKIKEN